MQAGMSNLIRLGRIYRVTPACRNRVIERHISRYSLRQTDSLRSRPVHSLQLDSTVTLGDHNELQV